MECKLKTEDGNQERIERINRYIMECKFNTKQILNVLNEELIDTLWNVNSLS